MGPVFTWSHADPFISDIVRAGYLTDFADAVKDRR
jgi:hypothetical protein